MKKLIKMFFVEPSRGLLMKALSPFEKRIIQKSAKCKWVPCFIVGPPRSGTTLLYELLISKFHLAYISNLAHRFYKTPVSTTMIGRKLIINRKTQFKSKYGHIKGWSAPNEGGWIWNQWFPQRHYLDEEFATDLDVENLQRTIEGISHTLDAPFLNKNVMHSVHMRLLDRIFPGCIFVHIHRDPVDNIRSIIRVRLDRNRSNGHINHWESVKPKEWKQFKNKHYVKQVCAQVYYTHQNIEEDIRYLGQNRRLLVDYKQLCSEPKKIAEKFTRFLKEHGITVCTKNEIPERFYISNNKLLDDETERMIEQGINRFWPNNQDKSRNG